MDYNPSKGAAFAVRSAYLDLLDLISESASVPSDMKIEALHSEAEEFVVAMIASVVLADGKIKQEEAEFLCELLNIKEVPISAVRYVNEYACRWPIISKAIPRFLALAVRHDRHIVRDMLCMIQTIGNNASVCDSQFNASEKKIVRICLKELERGIDKLIADASATA